MPGDPTHPNVDALRRTVGGNFKLLDIESFDELFAELTQQLADEDAYQNARSTERAGLARAFDDSEVPDTTYEDLDHDLMLTVMRDYCVGPADGGRIHEVRLAIVGPADDVAAARTWLDRLNRFMAAREGNSKRYPDWPGAPSALGVRFVIEERFIRPDDSARLNLAIQKGLTRDGFEDLLALFDGRIRGLLGDGGPDSIIVCLPEDIADLRVANPGLTPEERRALEHIRAEEESDQLGLFHPTPEDLKAAEELRTQTDDLLFRTFYRALKARAQNHVNPVPIQVLRRDTIERPDDKGRSHATRAWNIATSLYYKAGGLPWRPAELPDNVCFVGILSSLEETNRQLGLRKRCPGVLNRHRTIHAERRDRRS